MGKKILFFQVRTVDKTAYTRVESPAEYTDVVDGLKAAGCAVNRDEDVPFVHTVQEPDGISSLQIALVDEYGRNVR